MCYPCSENKGADQLHGYCEADLRLCFRIYAKSRFSYDEAHLLELVTITKCKNAAVQPILFNFTTEY